MKLKNKTFAEISYRQKKFLTSFNGSKSMFSSSRISKPALVAEDVGKDVAPSASDDDVDVDDTDDVSSSSSSAMAPTVLSSFSKIGSKSRRRVWLDRANGSFSSTAFPLTRANLAPFLATCSYYKQKFTSLFSTRS